MQEALRAFLLGSGSGVPAIVGSRVAWALNDQGAALPRIVLQRIDGAPEYADDGDANLTESRVQVDCYARTYEAAQEVARAVKSRVSGVVATQGGVHLEMYIQDISDTVETYDGGRNVFRVRIDLQIWHKETGQ